MNWSDLFTTNPSYFPKYGTLIGFTGGGGSGALAYATVTLGVITGGQMITGGTGYTSGPTPVVQNGSGTGFTGTSTISGGAVISWTPVTGGSGYVTGSPIWLLTFATNVWNTLVNALATWIDNVNANGKTLSNLGGLTLASGVSIVLAGVGNLIVAASGKIGINKSSPTTQLDIVAAIQPAVRVMGTSSISPAIHLVDAAGTSNTWSIQQGVTGFTDGQFSLYYTNGTTSGHRLILYPDGSIGFPAMPTSSPGAGTKKLWADPADSYRVKYAN